MDHNHWHHLSLFSELHAAYAEDLSDQLMSKYTSVGLLAVASVLAVKQYIFNQIQCWVPAEWPRPWEEYTESYCWIQNTYHVAYMTPEHPALHAREESEIGYFQWVPILLSLQALLVLLPHAFWRVAAGQSACDPNGVVKQAVEMTKAAKTPKTHGRLLTSSSRQLYKGIGTAKSLGDGSCPRSNCSGTYLFITYIISKLFYQLVGLAHLYLMKSYLGFDQLHFGWSCALDLLSGREWKQTRIFPRVTFCDVPVKHVGKWNVRSVQCVLPTNMLYEKIYMCLWFWIAFCMFLMAAFTLDWIIRLAIPSQRAATIKRLRRIMQRPTTIGIRKTEQPDSSLLGHLQLDGVFVLKMVASRCGELSAAEILDCMAKIHSKHNRPSIEFHDRTTLPLNSRIHDSVGNQKLNGGVPS